MTIHVLQRSQTLSYWNLPRTLWGAISVWQMWTWIIRGYVHAQTPTGGGWQRWDIGKHSDARPLLPPSALDDPTQEWPVSAQMRTDYLTGCQKLGQEDAVLDPRAQARPGQQAAADGHSKNLHTASTRWGGPALFTASWNWAHWPVTGMYILFPALKWTSVFLKAVNVTSRISNYLHLGFI
jgi:hypothetical protein